MRGYARNPPPAATGQQQQTAPPPDDALYGLALEILAKAKGSVTLFEIGIRLGTGPAHALRIMDHLEEHQMTGREGEGEKALCWLTDKGKDCVSKV